MEVAADQVPTGWSNDPNFLRLLLHPKSQEAYLARRCGLTDFKVLLRTTPDTGVMGYILQSGDNYYVSDSMIDHLFLITKPKTLPGILRTLDAEGLQGLRTRKLEEMFLDDEEEEEEEEEEEFRGKKLFTPIGRNAPAADQVPSGWSNDPNFLRLLFHPKSQEAYLARSCGLTDFKVLLGNTPDTGHMGFILQSGVNYYVGDLMIDHLFLITKPKTLPGILRTLDAEGLQGLRTRKLKEVFLDDEENDDEEEEDEEEFRGKKLFTPIGRNAPAN